MTTTLTLDQANQTYTAGDYTIFTNEWGVPGTGVSSSQAYTDATYTTEGGVSSVIFNNIYPDYWCPNGIWSYSEIYWGGQDGFTSPVTTTVSNIQSLLVNYSATLNASAGSNNDILIEIYTRNTAGQITSEIGVEPYSDWLPTSGGITYSDSHITANFSTQTIAAYAGNNQHTLENFRLTTNASSGTIDFAPLLKYLVQQGYLSASDYVSGVELGNEDGSGSNTFTVSSFSVSEKVNIAQTITDNGSTANQFFDVTTNNNYAIYGGQYGATDIVRINGEYQNFTVTEKPITSLTISVTIHGAYTPGTTYSFDLHANGQDLGTTTLSSVEGFTYQGGQYTSNQSFAFAVKGVSALSNLQITESSSAADQWVDDVAVNGIDLGSSNVNNWSGTTDTINATAWNNTLAIQGGGKEVDLSAKEYGSIAITSVGVIQFADSSIITGSATSADTIQVTGTGSSYVVHVLGDHSQYTETGIGTSTIDLSESASLNQNAVLNNISDIDFQDGFSLNTQSGVWTVTESAAALSSGIDALQALVAAKTLGFITLTDADIPTLTMTAAQLISDAAAIKDISGNFNISVTAPTTSASITGGTAGLGTTVVVPGTSALYTLTPTGDGHGLSVTNSTVAYSLNGVTAVQFSDLTDIIASQTPAVGAHVSSAQITELYGAVFGRLPDVGGLAFYEQQVVSSPDTSFTQYAEYFLSSPEYTGNAAHNYAQSAMGDASFITDSYQNLLHRAPESGAIPYYQNVIAQFTNGLTAGTAAYTQAELEGHAQVLAYFSQSPEFLSDVQVTAKNPSSAQHWLVLI